VRITSDEEEPPLTSTASLDRTSRLVAIGVFVAVVVDDIDLQMLALALPSIASSLLPLAS
jgi:hypothetical protein